MPNFEEIYQCRGKIVAVLSRSPMEQDRRRSTWYTFVGSIEMGEGTSEDKRTARVKELSLNGCYVDTENAYPIGTSLSIKLFTATEFFEAEASVIYCRPDLGMGLMFRETKPYYLMVLRKWLLAAMIGKKASRG